MICIPVGAVIVIGLSYFSTVTEIAPSVYNNVMYVATMLMFTGVIFVSIDIAEKYQREHPEAYSRKKK